MHHSAQVPSGDQVHDEIIRGIGPARVVNRHNVRMRQPRQGLNFAAKPLFRVRRFPGRRRQQFDRDVPLQPLMNGSIDAAHSAGAQFVEQQILAESLLPLEIQRGKLIRFADGL